MRGGNLANGRPSCLQAGCTEVAHFRLVILCLLLLAGPLASWPSSCDCTACSLMSVSASPLAGSARSGNAGTEHAVLPGMLDTARVAADIAAAVATLSSAAWLPRYRNGFFRRHTVGARVGEPQACGVLFRKLRDKLSGSTIWISEGFVAALSLKGIHGNCIRESHRRGLE